MSRTPVANQQEAPAIFSHASWVPGPEFGNSTRENFIVNALFRHCLDILFAMCLPNGVNLQHTSSADVK